MATAGHNLSAYNSQEMPNCADFKIGIVVSEWNDDVTSKLLEGALEVMKENGVKDETYTFKPYLVHSNCPWERRSCWTTCT